MLRTAVRNVGERWVEVEAHVGRLARVRNAGHAAGCIPTVRLKVRSSIKIRVSGQDYPGDLAHESRPEQRQQMARAVRRHAGTVGRT